MKYIVDVKDISYGRVEVEADSIEEAQEKAEEMYFCGQVPWADSDVSYEVRPDYRTPAYPFFDPTTAWSKSQEDDHSSYKTAFL